MEIKTYYASTDGDCPYVLELMDGEESLAG